MNKVKQKLAAGHIVTMFNPDFASPRLVEYVAGFGLDVAWLDAERQSYDFERIKEMTRAAHVYQGRNDEVGGCREKQWHAARIMRSQLA